MNYIKVQPVVDQPYRATVWRDRAPGPLTEAAEYLGRLTLHAERHLVCPRGEEMDTHWYTQLVQALIHLATGKATEFGRVFAVTRGHDVVGAAGYIDGRTARKDELSAAIRDNAEEKHAVTTNRYPTVE